MSLLLSILKDDFLTARRLENDYLEQLKSCPNGSFIVRQVRDKRYGYLTHRREGKVCQYYLGAMDNEAIKAHRDQMGEKKILKLKLRSVREQILTLKRALYKLGDVVD